MSNTITEIATGVDENHLKTAGFTDSGVLRFKKTLHDYAQQLYNKAVAYGTAKNATGYSLEITQENVQVAAHAISETYAQPEVPKWTIWAQIFEYILTAMAGFSAGKTDEKYGMVGFVVSTAIAVILFVLRQTKKQ